MEMAGKNFDEIPSSDAKESLEGIDAELEGVKSSVEEKYKNLGIEPPKRISALRYWTLLSKIDFSDNNVIDLVKKIPKEKRSIVLFDAAKLKDRTGLSDIECIQKAYKGEHSSDVYLQTESNTDNSYILNLGYKAIDGNMDLSKGIPVPKDMNIIFSSDSININVEGENKVLTADQATLQSLTGIKFRYQERFEEVIEDAIEKNPGISFDSLFNSEGILEIYVDYYNAWQEKTLNYKSLSEEDRQILRETFKADLSDFGYEVENVDANIVKNIEERNRRIREENQRRFEQWKKRNEKINSNLNRGNIKQEDDNTEIQVKSPEDIQNASGEKLAENAGLGKQLMEQNKNNDEIEEDLHSDDEVFSTARSRFIVAHDELKSSITEKTMLRIYDKNSNRIKSLDDDAWDGLKKIFKDHPDELKNIYEQISNFPNEVDNVRDELTKSYKSANESANESEYNRTLGKIIDYVRNMLKDASKGLRLKEQEPVKIEGDNLVISGEFNGADVIVRYDLKSGEVFMNSLVQYNDDDSKMIIGNNSVTNYKVGQLASFDNILSNHESLSSQFNSLGNIIVDKSKKQSAMNSIVIKFMKTFNITQNNQEDRSIVLDKGSNIFDVLQIIKNTEDLDTLEKFQDFMEVIMDYACLNWGENNLYGSQRNQGNGDKYDITFNENNNNKYISIVREYAKIFSENPGKRGTTENLNSDCQLGFADLIKKYITNDVSKPNWELAPDKMDDFINHLKTDNKE